MLSSPELTALAATGLVRFGSHTASHRRLNARIESATLEQEIAGSRDALRALTGQAIELFCFPNGDTSPAAIACVRRHYLGAVVTRSGWHAPGEDPYLIRRIGVHDDMTRTREGFLATLSGWL